MHHVWKLFAFSLLLIVTVPSGECRNVTHEDIRDAMLSLIHMFRTSEDKLERHEYREKALGEQLKKSLSSLDKKHRALEPLKGALSRLDERLSNVETILMQKEEREKSIQQKTNEALSSIQNALQLLTAKLLRTHSTQPVENNLTTGDDDSVLKKIEATNVKLDNIEKKINTIKENIGKDALKSMCQEMGPGIMSETEKLLNKYELKLTEMNNASRVQTDFVPLSEITLSDEAWHNKMTEVMDKQEKEIEKIHKVLSDAQGMWKGLPLIADINSSTNKTIEAVNAARYDIISNGDRVTLEAFTKLANKLSDMNDRTKQTNEDIQKSLTEGNNMIEHMFGDASRGYEQLRTEVQSLSKVERVMLQTADNVMDTKKRFEYGVHQITLEVGDLVRMQSNNLNRSINTRFDNIESTILDNQTGALANLSSKIESEMSQVWRQIGIMYQQLTASKTSLDRLQKQTEAYVNGSANTMDSMENKVGLITSRMGEVDENLNYLLGRLSLVTQEFNRIKVGLGDALDNIKTSFLTVQAKIKDAGPGPHNIKNGEKEDAHV